MEPLLRGPVKNYYWNSVRNFGDGLNPFILKRFADVDSVWDTVSHANVVAIGSILEHIPPLWDGHVLGTGKQFRDSRTYLYTGTATVWALRGPLSARGIKGSYALGDPGLLADELVSDQIPTRTFDLGVLPHWSDYKLSQRPEWYNDNWTTRVIMPSENPLQVVREISRCKRLVTSSLHGMIVADACGIPRRLEYTPTLDNEGGKFKFQDYSQSVQAPLEFGKMVEAPRFRIEDRKHELYDVFEAFGRYMRQT